jgi:hypothetical protein
MIRQYGAGRARGGNNPLRVGVIAVGTIYYLQADDWWHDRYRGAAAHRDPYILQAFINGTMGAARRNLETGLWESAYRAGRSDFAILQSLRDGRQRTVHIRVLIAHEDEGLTQQPPLYKTLPDLRLWRVRHRTNPTQRAH